MQGFGLLLIDFLSHELEADGETPVADRALNALAAGVIVGVRRRIGLGGGAVFQPGDHGGGLIGEVHKCLGEALRGMREEETERGACGASE